MKQIIIKYILFIPLLIIFCLCGTACVFIVGNLFSAPIETWADGLRSGILAWLVILGYTIWKDLCGKKEEK